MEKSTDLFRELKTLPGGPGRGFAASGKAVNLYIPGGLVYNDKRRRV
jgi:hypothetical protein